MGGPMDPVEVLNEIAAQVSGCQKCILKNTRKRSVPGSGPANAEIMLIGEGPGFNENEQGLPFVGAAGKFLDELLRAGGLARKDVFITNVVKCRPPDNRDPMIEELGACSEYLDRQIEVINPMVIVTLGRFSMARYFPNSKISAIHGKPTWVNGRFIIPMYHPAAALHQPLLKTSLLEDFSKLSKWIEEAKKKRSSLVTPPAIKKEEPPKEEPKQLDLFG